MNTSHRIAAVVALVSGLVLAAGSAFSQTVDLAQGLIGKSYVSVDYAYSNYSGSTLDNSNGAIVGVNLPLLAKWDFGASWEYGYISNSGYSRRSHTFTATALTYNTMEYGKPYFTASIGTEWDRISVAGAHMNDSGQLWGVGAGVEFPVGDLLAMDAGVSFTDSISSDRGNLVRYHLSGNQWFTPEVAGIATVSYDQIADGPDAVSFRIGVRWKF